MDELCEAVCVEAEEESEMSDEEMEEDSVTERLLFVSDLAWTVRRYCHDRSLTLFNRPDMVEIFLREFL